MIENVVQSGACYGCALCKAICPTGAIKMTQNELGFFIPKVESDQCVQCGKCVSSCIALSKPQTFPVIEAYTALAKDDNVTKKSSSGGMFIILSDWILKKGGVVWGCVLESGSARITCADNSTDRDKMCGSKYVQSSTNDCFQVVADQLAANRFVMFTGTPCQCAALRSFIMSKHIDDHHLFVMDFACHGVPSPKAFIDYWRWLETKYKEKIVKYQFRMCPNIIEGSNELAYAEFDHGAKYLLMPSYDPFYSSFLNDTLLRDSCYKCGFATCARVADITVADYNVNSRDSRSLLYINTEQGELWKKSIDENLFTEFVDYKNCLPPQMKHPVSISSSKIGEREAYKTGNFIEVHSTLHSHRKIDFIIFIEKILCKMHLFKLWVYCLNKLKRRIA